MSILSSDSLTLVSYLAPNWFGFYEAIAQYFGRALNIEVEISQSPVGPTEKSALCWDEYEIAFLCGLPLAKLQQTYPGQLQPIAAPVMQALRYRGQPIYFADVIVHSQSPYTHFEALRGKTFCYNDANSNSGYFLVQQHLQGQPLLEFFGQAIESGSHQQSMRRVIEGLADCAAIDSTVLERELQHFPELIAALRVVETIGPSPMPPIVATKRVNAALINSLRALLLHPDLELQTVMQQFHVQGFAGVDGSNYEAMA